MMFKGKKFSMDTLIGEGTVFEGRIQSEAGLRIEGRLTGDILCGGNVTVGEQAKVNSNIAGRDVVIAGVVHGHVQAKGKLTITSKGQLFGNANAAAFIIEEGGVFQGASTMDKPAAAPAGADKPVPQAQTVSYAAPAVSGFGTAPASAAGSGSGSGTAAPFGGGNPVVL